MKGWHGEPMRHSLAARGIPTYLYHGTTTGRFRDIKREGLSMDPGFRNWADSEFIYFTSDEDAVTPWAEHATEMYRDEYWDYPGEMPGYVSKTKPIVLRVNKEDLEEEDLIDDPILDELAADPDLPWVAYLNNIPPELIEVKTPTGWKRLKPKNFNLKFITGGDGVDREYHGYIAAVDPETGKIVGQVTYVYYNDKTYIKHIEVVPDYRRRGIGTALVKELKKESFDVGMMGNYATEEGQIFFGKAYPEILKPDLAELTGVRTNRSGGG